MLIELIENYCSEHGTTIWQIEHTSQLTNGTIGKWKSGKQKPSIKSLMYLSEFTGIPIMDLLKAWENDYGKGNEKHN